MLIVALVLAVIGLASLVTAVVTSNELVAWVCIGASVLGVILLIIDAIRERHRAEAEPALVGAGDEAGTASGDAIDETYQNFDAEYPEDEVATTAAADAVTTVDDAGGAPEPEAESAGEAAGEAEAPEEAPSEETGEAGEPGQDAGEAEEAGETGESAENAGESGAPESTEAAEATEAAESVEDAGDAEKTEAAEESAGEVTDETGEPASESGQPDGEEHRDRD